MFKFPYTNLHELNLDWILSKVKEFAELIPSMQEASADVQEAVDKADQAIETANEAKELAEQSVQAMIPDGGVTTIKLADEAVTTAKLADGSVTNTKIADDAITSSKMANNSVGNSELQSGCVSTGKIMDSAITSDKIDSNAVTSSKINNSAVTTNKIADNAVTDEKLSEGVVSRKNLIDNWYFVGGGSQQSGKLPINQRRATSYTGAGAYFIDRWILQNDTNAQLLNTGLKISGKWDIKHTIENLPSSIYTISILLSDYQNAPNIRLEIVDKYDSQLAVSNVNNNGLITATMNAEGIPDYVRCSLADNSGTSEATITAIKLERGKTQTLAYDDEGTWVLNDAPNYTEILLKCQEYFQIFKTSSLRPSYAEDFRPCMRTDPVLDSFTVNGVTYYSASSEI